MNYYLDQDQDEQLMNGAFGTMQLQNEAKGAGKTSLKDG